MSAHENLTLPPGSSIRQCTVLDAVATDTQGCLYRASTADDERSVLLYEFMPAGLALRRADGVHPRPGKADAFAKAQSAYALRLRAAALVGHPALPTLDDIWQEAGTVYAVSPWRDGRPLTVELSARAAPLELRTVQNWARTLCDALSALHRNDIVHTRLSPAMIRVLDSGELVLPPVGNGHHLDEVPAWVAPEQHPLNPKPVGVGVWTDIYQISALMHLLLLGTAPPTVLRRWEGAPLERLSALVGRVPEGLIVAMRQGLSMHPSARPQSVAAWLELAGLPDRRERSRYDLDDVSDAPSAAARAPAAAAVAEVAAPVTAPAPDAHPAASPAHGDDVATPEPSPEPAAVDARVTAEPAETAEPAPQPPAPVADSVSAPTPVAAEAPMPAPMPHTPEPGHQPIPPSIEARLERLERAGARGTPMWVWMSVLVAVFALGAILWNS